MYFSNANDPLDALPDGFPIRTRADFENHETMNALDYGRLVSCLFRFILLCSTDNGIQLLSYVKH